jgi:hypothetical protein
VRRPFHQSSDKSPPEISDGGRLWPEHAAQTDDVFVTAYILLARCNSLTGRSAALSPFLAGHDPPLGRERRSSVTRKITRLGDASGNTANAA